MSGDFGDDLLTITDEEGKEYVLEHLDTFEVDGSCYLAFLPADLSEDDEHYGLLILKKEEGNDEFLVLPDDDELDYVYDRFMERLYSEDDEEEKSDAEDEN